MKLMKISPESLTDRLKREAERLGFDLVGATPAVGPPRIEHFRRWLADGFAADMHYIADRAEAYEHPHHVLDGVKSILMLGTNYRSAEPVAAGPGQGAVSRYAWGTDYHDLIFKNIKRLVWFHRKLTPEAKVRGVLDAAPLLEREFAQLAGLGWIGKNTALINDRFGSWTFLAALLTSEELQYDEPTGPERCGSCTACLDACPTGALAEPYRVDARKCISYLTVELRDLPPSELRAPIDRQFFGCDACQDACPFNRDTPLASGENLASFQPLQGMNPIDLAELFSMDDETFRQRFRHTPLWRAKRQGLLCNAAVVLGNNPHEAAIPALKQGSADADPMVREACDWALKQASSEQ
jgi:epoxyqueuosine reductase